MAALDHRRGSRLPRAIVGQAVHGEAGQAEPDTHFRRWCSRRKPTMAPEWSDEVEWIGRECFSMHTTLGVRNQRWPPFHCAVVNSARSSSGNISARKNSSSLEFGFFTVTA
jgi:hypothetical protein